MTAIKKRSLFSCLFQQPNAHQIALRQLMEAKRSELFYLDMAEHASALANYQAAKIKRLERTLDLGGVSPSRAVKASKATA